MSHYPNTTGEIITHFICRERRLRTFYMSRERITRFLTCSEKNRSARFVRKKFARKKPLSGMFLGFCVSGINNKKIEHLASVTLQYFHKHQSRCTQRRYAIYVVFPWSVCMNEHFLFSMTLPFQFWWPSLGQQVGIFLSFVKSPYLANQDYFENLISDCLVGEKFGNKISKER